MGRGKEAASSPVIIQVSISERPRKRRKRDFVEGGMLNPIEFKGRRRRKGDNLQGYHRKELIFFSPPPPEFDLWFGQQMGFY